MVSVTEGSVCKVTDATSASMLSIERASGPAQLTPPVLTPLAGERVRGLDMGESSGRGDMVLDSGIDNDNIPTAAPPQTTLWTPTGMEEV